MIVKYHVMGLTQMKLLHTIIFMSRISSKAELSERVRSYLLSQLAGGQSVWNEAKLSQRFHVSRTPIREVLFELEMQGVIVRRHRRGIELRRPSKKEVADIYDVRIALERLAVGRVVRRITDEGIAELRQIQADIERAGRAGDVSLVEQLDLRLHMRLIDWSGNTHLRTMIDQFHLLIHAFQIGCRLADPMAEMLAPTHAELIDAIERRDRRASVAWIRIHLGGAKRELLKLAARSDTPNRKTSHEL